MFSAHSLAVLCVLIKVHSGKKKRAFFLRRPNSTSLLISSCSARSQGACGRAVKQIKHGGKKGRQKGKRGTSSGRRTPALFFFFPITGELKVGQIWYSVPEDRCCEGESGRPQGVQLVKRGGGWTLEEETGARSTPPPPPTPTLSN